MLKQVDEADKLASLYVMVNKLIFRRIQHVEAALRCLNQALQRRDWKTVKRLVRLLINVAHRGLMKNKKMILEVLDQVCQNCQSPSLRRKFALLLLIEGYSPHQHSAAGSRRYTDKALIELKQAADDGDAIANWVAGDFAQAEELNQMIHSGLERSYNYYIRSISLGCVRAIATVMSVFIESGHVALFCELMLLAARLGDCDAFRFLLARSADLVVSDAWATAFSAFIPHARLLAIEFHDPGAARLLCSVGMATADAAFDAVFAVRMSRVALTGGADTPIDRLPPFLGEHPWSTLVRDQVISGLASRLAPGPSFTCSIDLPSSIL